MTCSTLRAPLACSSFSNVSSRKACKGKGPRSSKKVCSRKALRALRRRTGQAGDTRASAVLRDVRLLRWLWARLLMGARCGCCSPNPRPSPGPSAHRDEGLGEAVQHHQRLLHLGLVPPLGARLAPWHHAHAHAPHAFCATGAPLGEERAAPAETARPVTLRGPCARAARREDVSHAPFSMGDAMSFSYSSCRISPGRTQLIMVKYSLRLFCVARGTACAAQTSECVPDEVAVLFPGVSSGTRSGTAGRR